CFLLNLYIFFSEMASKQVLIGIIVEQNSDFGIPNVKIASKDRVFEIDPDKLPLNVGLGYWVAGGSSDFDNVVETKRVRQDSRVVDGQVQVFSYVAVPFGHCSIRDGFLLPDLAKVWSPHLGYAFCEAELMFGLREEILYEAWFQYRSDCGEFEPIWELKVVGKPLIDSSKTILLKQTPWKLYSRKTEMGDTSQSAVLHADRKGYDRYYRGLVIALMNYPESEVILYSPICGIVSTTEKKVAKSIYSNLEIGTIVKFRKCTDSMTNEKYPEIKEIMVTTRRDLRFEVNKDKQQSQQVIKMLTSIPIDDDLLEEGGNEELISILSEYGPVTVTRETFGKLMEEVELKKDDLVNAMREGNELLVWILFVPIKSSWTISRIDKNWFKNKAVAEIPM
ncbi:hypothetical protein PMAYCL1PPCAC_24076, partial [Pristionchus mayeri]